MFPTRKVLSKVTVKFIIHKISTKVDLINVAVNSIKEYHKTVQDKLKLFADKNKLPDSPNTVVFQGSYNHETNLNRRLEFLEYIVLLTNN